MRISDWSSDVCSSDLITQAERRLFAFFCVTGLLWMFRQLLQQFSLLEGLSDTQIAIFGGFLMYIVPSGTEKKPLLDWIDAQNIPWGILLLFGGGLALAAAMQSSGILELTANYFAEGEIGRASCRERVCQYV